MDINTLKTELIQPARNTRVSAVELGTAKPELSAPAKAPDKAQVESAVSAIQEYVQSVRRDVNFMLDEGSGRVVVKVMDAASGSVIRQMPTEEALELAENLDQVRSLLFKAEA